MPTAPTIVIDVEEPDMEVEPDTQKVSQKDTHNPYSEDCMRKMQQESIEWLKSHVSIRFWDLFINKMHEINLDQREELIQINLCNNLSKNKSFLKWVSYVGRAQKYAFLERIRRVKR